MTMANDIIITDKARTRFISSLDRVIEELHKFYTDTKEMRSKAMSIHRRDDLRKLLNPELSNATVRILNIKTFWNCVENEIFNSERGIY
jgi:uncharacterized protein with von Willebrand factor type A (vWA) domain